MDKWQDIFEELTIQQTFVRDTQAQDGVRKRSVLNPTFAFWLPNFDPLPNYPSVEGPRDQKVTAYDEPACFFTGGFKVANIEEPTNFGHQLPAKPFFSEDEVAAQHPIRTIPWVSTSVNPGFINLELPSGYLT